MWREGDTSEMVESKATPGLPSAAASPDLRSKGRGIWDSGSARTVFGPVKEMLSEQV